MRINVTKQDIGLGIMCDPSECMVARAVRRTLNFEKSGRIFVYGDGIEIDKEFYELSPKTLDNIFRFDTDRRVKPFSFELDLTQPLQNHHRQLTVNSILSNTNSIPEERYLPVEEWV